MKTSRLFVFITGLLLAGVVPSLRAQTISNPSFETNTFSSGVGYASQNGGVITGWTISNTNLTGLNTGSGPFANNGAVPQGANVAFIQAVGGVTNTLSTTISNLVVGQTYRVTFRANCRNYQENPTNAAWSLNGRPFVPFTATPPVGGSNPYYTNSAPFPATATTAALVLRNGLPAGDATVLLDNFTITATNMVTTLPPTGQSNAVATLRGSVNPMGLAATAWFEWGTAANVYTATSTPVAVGSGQTPVTVTNLLTGLTPGVVYYYRVVATNTFGVARGTEESFGMPLVTTLPPTGQSNAVATLRGSVNPVNFAATAWFEWGTVANYYTATSTPVAVGSGGAAVTVSNLLTGLTPGVIYHYRIVATNTFGTAVGDDELFGSPFITLNGAANITNECSTAFNDPAVATSAPLGIAGGGFHSLALKSDGTVAAWEGNFYGQTNIPVGLSNVMAVAAGRNHSLALRSDGTVAAWGDSFYGQTNIPVGLSNVVAIAGGDNHNLALRSDGTVAAWGDNGNGQRSIPVGLSNVVAIEGGGFHSLVLKRDGTVAAWGAGLTNEPAGGSSGVNFGQSIVPAGLSNVVAIAGGGYHNLVLKNDGTVAAWGRNSDGQTTIPVGLTNVVAIAGGDLHSLALRRDGTVAAWGGNNLGQTTIPVGLSNVVAISAGGYHCLALKRDGTVVAWGFNDNGQTNVPAGLNTISLIIGGTFSTNNPPGTYTRTYTATNALGGIATPVSRTIVIRDTTPPVVTLLGNNPLHSRLGSAMVDPGATAADACAGSLPVITNSTVNINVASNYTIAYRATDSSANAATNTRTVIVRAPTILTVTNSANSGPGSLRDTLTVSVPGDVITFAPALSGATVTLASSLTLFGQTLDASSLPAGLTISGNNATRLFTMGSGTTNVLIALNLTGGNGSGGSGGAIQNFGQLTLLRCALYNNTGVQFGGAIFNSSGQLTLTNCTLTGNTATSAGSLSTFGGAIYSGSAVTLVHCTLTGNTAQTGGSTVQGGAIAGNAATFHQIAHSIVISNTATSGADIFGAPVLTGLNFIQTISGTATGTGSYTNLNPLLGPLANNGGPTLTRALATNSPAVDAAPASTLATDQRGAVRLPGLADIGAFEVVYSPLVTTTNDTGPGSLRFAVLYLTFGNTITFAPGLSGGTITLTSGELLLDKSLNIDASALSNGLTISGNTNSRIFNVASGTTNVLTALTLVNGRATNGGGIYNAGTLTVNQSTLSGNSAQSLPGIGGGIYNVGILTVNQSTLSGNSAPDGGGIYNAGTLTVNQSTLSGNSAQGAGGGILNNTGPVNLTNSIVASNTATNGANIFGSFSGGNNLTNGNPLLSPLGNYGGPTPTMPLLPGSPAIDGCTGGTSFATDQRGLPRIVGPFADIGAVEAEYSYSPVVTTTNDSGPGSLRFAVFYVTNRATITFAPGLSGATIVLTSGELLLDKSLTIDASALPNDLTISGNTNSRIFNVGVDTTNVLNSLTLVNGRSIVGGGIRNSGTLTVIRCTLSGNSSQGSQGGGGIYNAPGSVLTVIQSTLSGNSSQGGLGGGGIHNQGALTVNKSTLSGNSAAGYGGGIYNHGASVLTVNQSTISGNSANSPDGNAKGGGICNNFASAVVNQSTISGNSAQSGGSDPESGGGGIWSDSGLSVNNSIVAGNTAPGGPNTTNIFIPFFISFSGGNNLTSGNPLLAPLGNYGGPTRTRPPLPGSPAIDGCTNGASAPTDQRGLPRIVGAFADIGAVEGVFNPSYSLVTPVRLGNGTFRFSFTNLSGATFTVLGSTNVALPIAQWLNLGPAVETPANSGQFQFTDPQATNNPQRFYRVRVP